MDAFIDIYLATFHSHIPLFKLPKWAPSITYVLLTWCQHGCSFNTYSTVLPWVIPDRFWGYYISNCIKPGITDDLWLLSPGGRFKNAYELLNLRALKIPMLYKNRIFQCMSKIFCVEFQRVPLKFHTKYLTHTVKDIDFIHRWRFKSS